MAMPRSVMGGHVGLFKVFLKTIVEFPTVEVSTTIRLCLAATHLLYQSCALVIFNPSTFIHILALFNSALPESFAADRFEGCYSCCNSVNHREGPNEQNTVWLVLSPVSWSLFSHPPLLCRACSILGSLVHARYMPAACQAPLPLVHFALCCATVSTSGGKSISVTRNK